MFARIGGVVERRTKAVPNIASVRNNVVYAPERHCVAARQSAEPGRASILPALIPLGNVSMRARTVPTSVPRFSIVPASKPRAHFYVTQNSSSADWETLSEWRGGDASIATAAGSPITAAPLIGAPQRRPAAIRGAPNVDALRAFCRVRKLRGWEGEVKASSGRGGSLPAAAVRARELSKRRKPRRTRMRRASYNNVGRVPCLPPPFCKGL